MIPDIGLIIAAYVVTRMVELLNQPMDKGNWFVRLCALGTILVTLFFGYDLWMQGVRLTATVPGLGR